MMRIVNMKRFWYSTKKCGDLLKIYYKLMDDQGGVQFYLTHTKREGNKRIKLVRTLMKNNWPVVTKRLTLLNPIELTKTIKWKEVDEEEMLGYLRRGNPDDNARSSLLQFFGSPIFCLTNFELQYFKSSFHNLSRLISFYHVIRKECRRGGVGYTYRVYGKRSILITPAKIKKAMIELFKVDPQEVLFPKEKNNNKKK